MKINRRQIPGYELLEVIASGGMGTVFKARQTSLDKMVALKLLSPNLARDSNYVERFVREARALAKLNHPNVVTVIDVGRADEHYYLIMELVPGKTFADLIEEKGCLPQIDALSVILSVARALQHAEKHHLIHRDIKPENILFSEENVCKLCDLGLARRSGPSSELTAAGIAMGTPDYIAPEQARGLSELDIRTDIYSLGATLFHSLTGKPPFDGPTPGHIMRAHIDNPLEFPPEPALDANVRELVEKMMAKNPALRQQSAGELIADIEAVMAGSRVSKPKAVALKSVNDVVTTLQKHWKIAACAAAAAVVAIVLLAILVPSPGTDKAPDEKETKQPDTPRPGGMRPYRRRSTPKSNPPAETPVKPSPPLGGDYEDIPSEAQLAYEAAVAVEKDPASSIQEAISEYRMVSQIYPGTAWGEKALARAQELEKTLDKQQSQEARDFADARTAANSLLKEGRYREALLALTRFATRYPGTSSAQRARVLARQMVGTGAKRFAEKCAEADRLAASDDFAGARKILESLQDSGIPELDTIIRQKRVLLSEQEKASVSRKRLRDRGSLYEEIVLELYGMAQDVSLEKALQRVVTARKEPKYKLIADVLELEEEDIRNAMSVLKAAEEGLRTRTGSREQLVYRKGGTVWGKIISVKDGAVSIAPEGHEKQTAVIRIEELDDRQIVNLTAFGKTRSSNVSKLLFYAARGNVQEALGLYEKLPPTFSGRNRIAVKLHVLRSASDAKAAEALVSKMESAYKSNRTASAAEYAKELFEKYAHTDFLVENAQRLGRFVPQQGLLRIYSRAASFRNLVGIDVDLLPSFAVSQDAIPERGTLYTRWEGLLKVPSDGTYRFHVMTTGPVRLKLGSRWALRKKASGELEIFTTEEKLRKGLTEIVFEVTCSKGRRPIIQLFWQREDGPRAPLTPVDVFHLPATRDEYEEK
jgi:serine/threonine protein kinase